MHYTCRFFSSTNTPQTFSRHWENEPDDQRLFSQRGHLFGLITIKNPQSDNIGSQIISQINQTYFSETEASFQSHLKDTLTKINDLWQDQKPSILLLAVNHGQLTAASVGQSQLFLKRQTNFSLILDNSSDQVNFISGPIKDMDLLFMTNPDFSKNLPDIQDFFSKPDLNQQEDYIRDNISAFPSSSILIQVNQDDQLPSRGLDNSPTFTTHKLPLSQTLEGNLDIPVLPKRKKTINLKLLSKIFPKKALPILRKHNNSNKRNKKINLILISLSFLALTVSIYIGYQKNQLNQKNLQFTDIEKQITESLDNINKVRQLNFEDALILAQQTKDLIDKLDLLSINPDKVSQYRSEIEDILSQTGSTEFSNIDQLHDTSLITDDPSYSDILFDQGSLYLLDNTKNRIDQLTIQSKATKSISQDDQISQVIKTIVLKNDVYALTKDALYLVKKTNWQKSIDLTDLNISSIQVWASSMYFLSPSTIYKSSLINNILSEPASWLEPDQVLPDNPISLAIDGKIWLLTKQAKIIPYLRGVQDNFKLTQAPQTDSASNLNIGVDSDLVIFLANPNSLFVYSKLGDLLSKYNFDNKNILSISLDESTQTVYLLSSDQKIYKLPL